jgi:hypothetical protein
MRHMPGAVQHRNARARNAPGELVGAKFLCRGPNGVRRVEDTVEARPDAGLKFTGRCSILAF